MKIIVKLIIILGVFTQICHAQKIETVEEYKILYDNLVSHLRLAEKDTNRLVDKPFSEFVKCMDEYSMKIIEVAMEYKLGLLYPKDILGLRIYFTTDEINSFASNNWLWKPFVVINFQGTKPFETGLSLTRKYKGSFTEEVEKFYSDAIIKSIGFYGIDNMYQKRPIRSREMKSRE